MVTGKKGWIRVLEVFIALLMITAVSLIAINKEYQSKGDSTSTILKIENSILREIQLDDNLRKEILDLEELPLGLESFSEDLKSKIESKIPSYLECDAILCEIGGSCEIETPSEKDIYVQSAIITANKEIYNPTFLKLVCWRK